MNPLWHTSDISAIVYTVNRTYDDENTWRISTKTLDGSRVRHGVRGEHAPRVGAWSAADSRDVTVDRASRASRSGPGRECGVRRHDRR
jgi:hypothetical protein